MAGREDTGLAGAESLAKRRQNDYHLVRSLSTLFPTSDQALFRMCTA